MLTAMERGTGEESSRGINGAMLFRLISIRKSSNALLMTTHWLPHAHNSKRALSSLH